MKITKEKISKLDELSAKLKKAKYLLSENLKTVQDRGNNNLIKLTRNGKEINLAEKVLWEEVYQGGTKSQAGEILSKKYPAIFEYQVEVNKLVQELNIFTAKELGFIFSEMTMNSLLALINGVVDYNLSKRSIFTRLYGYTRKTIKKWL